ncbi:MAG: hypothetical protein SH856_04895 [Flavobacteriales bacterium]|nr:hypothetical protein [Flavobacteriales bacterium]
MSIQIATLSVRHSEFSVAPDFDPQLPLIVKDYSWWGDIGFNVKHKENSIDELSIHSTVQLLTAMDKRQVCKLRTDSCFSITTGLSMELKRKVFRRLANQTVAHQQGGWASLHKNAFLRLMMPQGLNSIEQIWDRVEKEISEQWP